MTKSDALTIIYLARDSSFETFINTDPQPLKEAMMFFSDKSQLSDESNEAIQYVYLRIRFAVGRLQEFYKNFESEIKPKLLPAINEIKKY